MNAFVAHACASAAAKVSAQTSTEHNTVKQSWSDSMFFFCFFYKTAACFIAQSSVCSVFAAGFNHCSGNDKQSDIGPQPPVTAWQRPGGCSKCDAASCGGFPGRHWDSWRLFHI